MTSSRKVTTKVVEKFVCDGGRPPLNEFLCSGPRRNKSNNIIDRDSSQNKACRIQTERRRQRRSNDPKKSENEEKKRKSGRVQKRTVEKEETKTNDNILARILGPRKRNASIDCGKMLQIRVRELMQLTINLCTTERNQQPQMKMRKHQNKKQMRHY